MKKQTQKRFPRVVFRQNDRKNQRGPEAEKKKADKPEKYQNNILPEIAENRPVWQIIFARHCEFDDVQEIGRKIRSEKNPHRKPQKRDGS